MKKRKLEIMTANGAENSNFGDKTRERINSIQKKKRREMVFNDI